MEAFAHHGHLHGAIQGVLPQAVFEQRQACASELKVFIGFKELLARGEVLFIQSVLLLPQALLAVEFSSGGEEVLFYLKAFLLHGYLRVAKHVLLLCKLRFGVKDLLAQPRVVERKNNVAGVNHGALFHPLCLHHSRFEGGNLNDYAGFNLSVEMNIIVEFSFCRISEQHSGCSGAISSAVIAD